MVPLLFRAARLASLLVASCVGPVAADEAIRKPNIIVIVTDDISEETDKLADESAIANELRERLIEWESQMIAPKPRGGLNAEEQEWFKEKLK